MLSNSADSGEMLHSVTSQLGLHCLLKSAFWAFLYTSISFIHIVENYRMRFIVGEGYSQEFEVKVGVHQGSVLSRLLFISVLDTLSREFRSVVLWKYLYADDLVIIADSLEECVRRIDMERRHGKEGVESKCRKDKVMICGTCLDLL